MSAIKLRVLAFFTSLFSAGIGIGGGCLLIPGLISIKGNSYQKAASTSLVLISITAFIASISRFYSLAYYPNFEHLFFFIPSCMLGAFGAGPYIKKINGKGLKLLFSLFIILAALKMLGVSNTIASLFRLLDQIYPHNFIIRLLPFGILVGVVATLLGVGCGLVIVPFFVIFMGENIHSSVFISLISMLFLTSFAAFIHRKYESICYRSLHIMVPFVILGAIIGTMCSSFLPEKSLKMIFAFFLIFTSMRFLFEIASDYKKEKILRSEGFSPQAYKNY